MKFQKNLISIVLIIILLVLGVFFLVSMRKSNLSETQTISENIGGKVFLLEIASNEASRELGLGKRDSLVDDDGMIFVFDKLDKYGFWMKDTKFPLDILWLNENCTVVGKASMYPESFPKAFYPDFPALYAIEIPINSAKNIKESDTLSCEKIKTIQTF